MCWHFVVDVIWLLHLSGCVSVCLHFPSIAIAVGRSVFTLPHHFMLQVSLSILHEHDRTAHMQSELVPDSRQIGTCRVSLVCISTRAVWLAGYIHSVIIVMQEGLGKCQVD